MPNRPLTPTQLEDLKLAAALIGAKWKTAVLACLAPHPLRFAALRRAVGGISEKVLIQQLRQLEASGLVDRSVKHTVPPEVTYAMSAHARTLCDVIDALAEWGGRHRVWSARRRR